MAKIDKSLYTKEELKALKALKRERQAAKHLNSTLPKIRTVSNPVVLDEEFPHLGGNNELLNRHTFCPESWSYIIDKYKIKSVLDVGSGYGHAPKWFSDKGLTAIAIDGLQKNVDNAIYPTTKVDLIEGSYTAEVEMVNCIEVVEHVSEEFLDNLLETLCCGKYIFMTHGVPGQRGHHHVNCQPREYWVEHMSRFGFEFDEEMTDQLKQLAGEGTHYGNTGLFFCKKD